MEHLKSDLKLYDWQEKIVNHKGNVTIRGGRQDGKSLSVARRIFKLMKDFPGSRHLIIAASERQENYLFERLCELIGDNYTGRKTLSKIRTKEGTEVYKFPVGVTGKYLEGLPSVDFLHADEAIHIKERVWDSILPMLAEPRKRGLGWITLLSSTRGRPKGYFFKSFSNKNFLQVQVKSEDCPHISKEFLAEEKHRLGERMYKVIYDGEFDELAMCYFPSEIIDRAVKIGFFMKNEIKKDGKYYLGIDPARFGRSKAAFAVSELDPPNKMKLIYGNEIPKSSLNELRNETKKLEEIFNFRKIFIDDGGVGAGLIEFLEEDKKIKRKLRPMNNASSGKKGKILKEDLYSNLLRLLESEKLFIVNDEKIIEGLKKVEFDEEGKIIGTDMSEACVRACWGIKEKYLSQKILTF